MKPLISPEVIALLLNSRLLDEIFRCINGSVAVSAYEIESMPMPSPGFIASMGKKLSGGIRDDELERELQQYYGMS